MASQGSTRPLVPGLEAAAMPVAFWGVTGSSSDASLTNSMFFLSYTIGRFALLWVIEAISLKWQGELPVSLFISLSIIFQLMFWPLPTFVGSSIA